MNVEPDRHLLLAAAGQGGARGLFRRAWDFVSRHYALLLVTGIFVVPVTWALLFYGLIAADRYVSETKFIVRGVNSQQIGGLSVLLRSFGLARANDDAYAIHSYIRSRDAMDELMKQVDLRAVYTRPEADFITGYSTLFGDTSEGFFRYFSDQIVVEEDIQTGITTLRVSAYRPQDAVAIARALLSLSEARVNQMNDRARRDALDAAGELLSEAETRVIESQTAITAYRNRVLMVDPEENVSKRTELIAALTSEMVEDEVLLRQLRTSSPNNPRIPPLVTKITSLRDQIAEEQGQIAGSDASIASKISDYEGLVLKRVLADKAFESAMRTIDNARQETQRKRIYIEAVVSPHQPDKSTEPKRLRRIFTVMIISFAAFVMIYLLVSGGRDHLNIH
ncbi:hypothetical protein [Celeribacter sp.]|uniref:hypothetical protein n=1 Tax=Alphaproteobacteria TaxID=28211 RepID=UPI003A8F1A10